MEHIKLISIDLDGTLIRPDKTITVRNIETIREAVSNGLEVVIATGRSYDQAVKMTKDLKLKLAMVTVGGADVRIHNGETIRKIYLERSQIYSICERIKNYNLAPIVVYTSEDYFRVDLPKSLPLLLDSYKILKIVLVQLDPELKQTLKGELSKIKSLTVTSTAPSDIEILHEKANKGDSLLWLAKQLGIKGGEIASIGDSDNDIDMFKISGISFAMANANSDVKKIASFTLKHSCVEDGVHDAIKKILQYRT
ncbi:MAG: HAD family phosphatase [Brevibacillus sp.]|nr:HAD family phosphatase [Brevibacillus sp.]